MGGVWFVAAVESELGELPGVALGVGPLRAAATLARALATAPRPSAIVLVGTAGAYPRPPGAPPAPQPGDVVVSDRLGWADLGATAGLGYVPLAPPPLASDPGLVAALGGRAASVLTLASITTDPAQAEHLGVDWEIEHMEAYGAALAAAEAGVPFVAVLGVSNAVGPGAHAAWKANRAAAEAAARAHALAGVRRRSAPR
jgi:futalosine hydrolase